MSPALNTRDHATGFHADCVPTGDLDNAAFPEADRARGWLFAIKTDRFSRERQPPPYHLTKSLL